MNYLAANPLQIAQLLFAHLFLTIVALAIAVAIALPVGVYAARNKRAGRFVLGLFGTLYTIPSLALLALLVPVFGLGFWTAVVALVAYAQMILVRNVVTALRNVPPALIEVARGLGMTPWQSFARVEFPQALPVVVGGIRVAAVTLIALANLAAWIDAGGLGTLIFTGIREDDPQKIVAGSLASAALAIGADMLLRAFERRAFAQAGTGRGHQAVK